MEEKKPLKPGSDDNDQFEFNRPPSDSKKYSLVHDEIEMM